jgi:hypothetical protein
VGSATLKPGDKANLGTIQFEYDPQSWIGTMEVGGRGPALMTLIDRGEAGEGPWGGQEPLSSGAPFAFEIGPYAFEGRAAAGEPPASVEISVARRRCPPNDIVAKLDAPMWAWLGTGAIQLVTFRPDTDMVQVSIAAYPTAPGLRIDFSTLSYRRWFVPELGKTVRVQGPGYVFTLEQLVSGKGTRFEGGAWISAGQPTANALVRVEAVDGERWPSVPVSEAPSACGEPTAGRAALPAALTRPPSAPAAVTVEVGTPVRSGDLELTLSETVLPPLNHFDEPETYRELALRTADGALMRSASLGGFGARHVRLGELLVRIGAESVGPNRKGDVSAEIVRLPCPNTATAPLAEAPATTWLSTRGLETVVLTMPGSADQMGLALSLDGDALSLSVSASDGYYSCQVRPDIVGRVFELGGARFEIAAVESSGDTRFDGQRWTTSELVPAVHVAIIAAKVP